MAQFRSFTSQHSLHVIPEKQKNLTSKTWNKKLFNYLIKKMGLCKCPKRRVTNQFCFEHRVNVCEWCMVQKHPKVSYHINIIKCVCNFYEISCKTWFFFQCVVQSYLQWLQDSDYNPNCSFCDQELQDEPCVRLVCYRKFEWTSWNVMIVWWHPHFVLQNFM